MEIRRRRFVEIRSGPRISECVARRQRERWWKSIKLSGRWLHAENISSPQRWRCVCIYAAACDSPPSRWLLSYGSRSNIMMARRLLNLHCVSSPSTHAICFYFHFRFPWLGYEGWGSRFGSCENPTGPNGPSGIGILWEAVWFSKQMVNGKWLHLYSTFLTSGHSKRCTILPNIHLFMHTFTPQRQWQPP